MKKMLFTWSVLLTFLLIPALASASVGGAEVIINDLEDGNPTVVANGFDTTSLTINYLTEGIDLHGEYVTILAPSPGNSVVSNFNFMEPSFEGGGISDTLSITFTGQTRPGGLPGGMSVDLHFRSETESGPPLTELSNGISITETGALQDLSQYVGFEFFPQVASDISAVPEPSTMLLLGSGIVGLIGVRRKFRK